MTDLQKQVLGAAIGLSKASLNNPFSEYTTKLLCESLFYVEKNTEDKLEKLLVALHAEKNMVSPDCARCPNPCGNTDDYDFALMENEDTDKRTAKLDLLSQLYILAEKVLNRPEFNYGDSEFATLLLNSYSVIGYEVSLNNLNEKAENVRNFNTL